MRQLIFLTVLLALTAAVAFSQASGDNWASLKQLRVGQKINVVDTSSKKIQGQFLGLLENGMSLRVKGKELTVPRSEVVLVTQPTSRVKTVLLGILAGALLGAQAWMHADRRARGCWDDAGLICDREKGLSPRSVLIFAGVGAGGLGLASAISKAPGKVLYAHDPNAPADPVATDSVLQPLPIQPRRVTVGLPSGLYAPPLAAAEAQAPVAKVLEGGNVFAPAQGSGTTEPLANKAPEGHN